MCLHQGLVSAKTKPTASAATETDVDKIVKTQQETGITYVKVSNITVKSSASEVLITESENPDLSEVGLTPDLLIKLQTLGHLDARFNRIEDTLKNLEVRC